MALLRLDITDFRNLTSVKLEPIPQGFNLIFGNNGSGKTSLLEAIYYLSLGRSFRSTVISHIIGKTADKFSLFANIMTAASQSTPIGIERHQCGEIKMRISGKDARSIAELANLTPIQLINSHCYNLLDTPSFRRRYLDWGAFYISRSFWLFITLVEVAAAYCSSTADCSLFKASDEERVLISAMFKPLNRVV